MDILPYSVHVVLERYNDYGPLYMVLWYDELVEQQTYWDILSEEPF